MFARALPIVITTMLTCGACAPKGGDDWSNIDYSKVYKAAGQRDMDSVYRQPSVLSCVDDDLINCK